MPLLLSFGAPVCFPRGFGGCELLSIAGAAAGGGGADGSPFLLHPAGGSPASSLPRGPLGPRAKTCGKPDLSLLKRENTISRRHLHSLVVSKTILHLLNNTNIAYSSTFIMKSMFETMSGKLLTLKDTHNFSLNCV